MTSEDEQREIDRLTAQLEVLRERQEARRFKRDTQLPWAGIEPNDRERELALRTMNAHNRGDATTPALLSSFARALAAYRVELSLDPKDRYALQSHDPQPPKEHTAHD